MNAVMAAGVALIRCFLIGRDFSASKLGCFGSMPTAD